MRKPVIQKLWGASILLILLSLACSTQVTVYGTPSYPNVETLVSGTLVVLTENAPTATKTSLPTDTPVPASATPEEFGEVYVYTAVENVNLRVNPGLLFQVSRVLPQNTRLQLLGQSPGGDWVNVQNDEGIVGWVSHWVVTMDYQGPPLPVIEPEDVILITGTVTTELGTPVSGIGFDLIQGSRRTDAITNGEGRFYAYLPANMSGTWTVKYVSVACTSNTMDVNCNCISNSCGTAHPESMTIQLPQSEPSNFVWK
jgi:uncharacterized protein YraI